MNIIKKATTSIATTFSAMVFTVNNALAAQSGFFDNSQGGAAAPNASAQGNLGDNIAQIINYFLGMLGLVAVAMLIYAGVLMVTAAGDEEAIGKAKKIITYAVIGIVIIVLSYTIIGFVTGILG